MTRTLLHRPARVAPPPVPGAELAIPPPPSLPPASATGGWITYVLPAVGSLGSLIFILANPTPLFVIGGILFALTAVLMGVGMALQQRLGAKKRRDEARVRYLAHLDDLRRRARAIASAQADAARFTHPAPTALTLLGDTRVWERRPGHADFLAVRIGTGPVPLAAPVTTADLDQPLADRDPVCVAGVRRLLDTVSGIPGQPLVLDLSGSISIVGPAGTARALTRSLAVQAAAWHAPTDLRIAVLAPGGAAAEWAWLKWLPHAEHPSAMDALGRARLVTATAAEFANLLGAELARRQRWSAPTPPLPRLLIIADLGPARPTADDPAVAALLDGLTPPGVALVTLVDDRPLEPGRVDARIIVSGNGSLQIDGTQRGEADAIVTAEAETVARRLAPLAVTAEADDRAARASTFALLPDEPSRLDPSTAWVPRPAGEDLTVSLGTGEDGHPVVLDLKESALGGHGPHGLAVGATGSGKSELLRTLVLGLAARHAPTRLAFVLVDFKGGATFAPLAPLPHVAGVITNLQDDLGLVDRVYDALYGELQRRQELLRSAGGFPSVREYAAARAAGADLEPLPALLVVVDEFSELLASRPDFIDAFVAIGRLGRSLGMHLLLASQRLEEGRLRGLDSHLSYRIGLRTFSAADSRAVLGVPDAYQLPPVPGAGYLKVDTTVWQRFTAAYVSGPHVAPPPPDAEAVTAVSQLLPFTAANVTAIDPSAAFGPADEDAPSVLDVAVARLRDAAPRAFQVWLPPLAEAAALDDVLDPAVYAGTLGIPIGVVDRPREQRRDALVVDLAGAAGNVAIAGGPQSGKSTAVRTLVAALSLTHRPDEVAVYAIDMGGGLAPLTGLPHVGTVATRAEPELVRRVVGECARLLVEREERFRRLGIDSPSAFRRMRLDGRLPDELLGDVVLVIDGWAAFRRDYEELEPAVTDLAARGLGYGVHVVVTANRWFDIRAQLKDSLGTRIELRLGDPVDSEVDRKLAAAIPAGHPGRALTSDKLHALIALPRVDGDPDPATRAEGFAKLAAEVSARWAGAPTPPPVRTLPREIARDSLPAPGADAQRGIPIGLRETDLGPAVVDLAGTDPHLIVLGDGQSGKTTLLRTFLLGLIERRTPEQVRVVVVDYRRTLLDVVPASHLLGYAGSEPALAPMISEITGSMNRRLPGSDVTAEQLRARSWWSGPELMLVIDDYDLVVTGTSSPLTPLVPLLAQGADIGLHVILARRVGGMSRGMYEPFLARLRELGTPGFLLAGDPGEGPVLGPHRASATPPGRALWVHRTLPAHYVQVAH